MKAFVLSQFSFSPLVGMFVDRTINAKIDALQYRALKIVYRDNESSFEELLRREVRDCTSCSGVTQNSISGVTQITYSISGVTQKTYSSSGVTQITYSISGVTPNTYSSSGVTPITYSSSGVTQKTYSISGVTPITYSSSGVTPGLRGYKREHHSEVITFVIRRHGGAALFYSF